MCRLYRVVTFRMPVPTVPGCYGSPAILQPHGGQVTVQIEDGDHAPPGSRGVIVCILPFDQWNDARVLADVTNRLRIDNRPDSSAVGALVARSISVLTSGLLYPP